VFKCEASIDVLKELCGDEVLGFPLIVIAYRLLQKYLVIVEFYDI